MQFLNTFLVTLLTSATLTLASPIENAAPVVDIAPVANTAQGVENIAPVEKIADSTCQTYADCGFCGLYERCCYIKEGATSGKTGYCKCGTSGQEQYCA